MMRVLDPRGEPAGGKTHTGAEWAANKRGDCDANRSSVSGLCCLFLVNSQQQPGVSPTTKTKPQTLLFGALECSDMFAKIKAFFGGLNSCAQSVSMTAQRLGDFIERVKQNTLHCTRHWENVEHFQKDKDAPMMYLSKSFEFVLC